MARTVQCIYLKKEAEGMDYAPYPGELGKRIYNQVSKEAWQLWMKHQTMLVNENRLNLADQRARQYLARQMENFFFGGGAEQPAGYVPPPTGTPEISGAAARCGIAIRSGSRLEFSADIPQIRNLRRMATLQELIAQKEALEREIETHARQERARCRSRKVRTLMEEHGLSVSDLSSNRGVQDRAPARAPRSQRNTATPPPAIPGAAAACNPSG